MKFASTIVMILSIASFFEAAFAMPSLAPRWRLNHKWSEIDRMPRHRAVMTAGVPEPYLSMRNPLPASTATINRGAIVYARNCVSCHGAIGEGNGPGGRNLSPLPADLAWLSWMKISQSDGFMYWTIAEGGTPFATPMPPFKDKLPAEDIWALTTFIQAHLVQKR